MPREVPLATMVEIAARAEADVPLLFGLAKGVFAGLPGWSDQRVLEVLRGDLVFVAREQGQPAGYVALHRAEDGAILIEQLFVAPGHERRGIGHRLLAHAEGYAIAQRRAASTSVRASRRPSGSCTNGCSRAPSKCPRGWRQWQPES